MSPQTRQDASSLHVNHELHCPSCGAYSGTQRTPVGFRAVAIQSVQRAPREPSAHGLEYRRCGSPRHCPDGWLAVEIVWVGIAELPSGALAA